MEAISYKLDAFEGPLDLLLFLVQKNKLNIYDIPIAQVLEQYMDAIRRMQEIDMDVASEFLDMAARLVQIKSFMLLPRHEEGEKLRAELTGELIEYQLCQEAAKRLAGQSIVGDIFVRAPMQIEPDLTYRLTHPATVLLDAYLAAAGRGRRRLPPPAQAFHGIVAHRVVSVSSKIVYVLRRLREREDVTYRSLFDAAEDRSELVATFLAVLELMKAERVYVEGDGDEMQVHMRNGDNGEWSITEEELTTVGSETVSVGD